ncbi:hypothetical protein Tco_0495723 [Tanacetum coccineum]
MHIWCGRRSVPRPRSQHARNQSLSKKSRSGDEAAITPSIERSGSSKRSPIDEKGLATSTSLFRQPCLASPRNKLQFNGKTGFSTGTRYKKAEEILSGTPDGGNHRPTHQTDLVTQKTSIRSQILADFIAERPDEEDPPMETPIEEVIPEPWTLFTDRSSCLEGSGAGLILTSLEYEALVDRNNV